VATTVRKLIGIFEIRADKRQMVDATDAMDKGEKQAKKTDKALKGLMDAFKAFGITLGAGFLLSRIRSMTTDFIKTADALDKTGQQVGIGTTQLQAFRHAADLSGVSASEFDQTVGQLQRNMREFTRGSASMVDAFNDLGVTVTDESGRLRNAGDVIYDIADAMQNIEDPAARVGLSMTVFGRSGRRMLPMLINGSAALREMTGELALYGGGISEQAIENSVILVDTIARFRLAMRSFASAIAVEVLPKFTELITAISRAVVWIKETIENSHILRATAITVGAALAGVGVATAAAWGPAALTVGLTTAAVLLAALAIDDLWVTMEGGQSVTRDFIDGMTEAGTTTQIVNNIKQAWVDLTDTIQAAWDYISPTLIAFGEWLGGWEGISKGIIDFILPIIPALETLWGIVSRISGALESIGVGVHIAGAEDVPQREVQRQRRIRETAERARVGRQQRRERRAEEQAVFEAGVELVGTPEAAMGLEQVGLEQSIWFPGEAEQPIPRAARRRTPRPIRRAARGAARPAIPAAIAPEASAMVPTAIQPQVIQGRQVTQNVDARTTVGQIVVQGTADPEETARAVDRRIRQREGQTLRSIQSLVPVAERG
jgi:hypothetical protein